MLYWKYLQWDQTGSPKKPRSARTETKIICWREWEVCWGAEKKSVFVALSAWQLEVKVVLIAFKGEEHKVR